MNDQSFIPENPIIKAFEDKLGRTAFVAQLREAIASWKNNQSLIISLNGKWGEGKSSIINLLKEQLKTKTGEEDEIPTIIEFNPWIYSNNKNLSVQFFEEISTHLGYNKKNEVDYQISKKLELYSNLINFDNEKSIFNGLTRNILVIMGIIGFSLSQILNLANFKVISIVLSLISILFILSSLSKVILGKFSMIYRYKSDNGKKTIGEVKEDLKEILINRQKKLLIIIDDIDRLTKKEIKEIFKLTRINADFPNTIYLLSFEQEIIIKSLNEENGISGAEYLKKIVQVNFDLPLVNQSKIHSFLFDHLNNILLLLPNGGERFFTKENEHWSTCFNAGYNNFFTNIRDVKRYYNSLLLNIKFLIREETYEVNPVDFFCIEAIRVFAPEFYGFIKMRKHLFANVNELEMELGNLKKTRAADIDQGFELIPKNHKQSTKNLIFKMFPQLDNLFEDRLGSTIFNYAEWRRELRICSTEYFDAYFTLIPGGNDGELTQYEIDSTIAATVDSTKLESIFNEFIQDKRINNLLERLQDYTENKQAISSSDRIKNLIVALLNITDKLSSDSIGLSQTAEDMNAMRIIYQLLASNEKHENNKILEETINRSNGIYGAIFLISIQTQAVTNKKDGALISESHLSNLQQEACKKIDINQLDEILSNKHFHYIIYRFKEWSDKAKLDKFINSIKSNDRLFMKFCSIFVNISHSYTEGKQGRKEHRRINFKGLDEFIGLTYVSDHLEKISKKNQELYGMYSPFNDQYKKDINRYLKEPEAYSNNIWGDY